MKGLCKSSKDFCIWEGKCDNANKNDTLSRFGSLALGFSGYANAQVAEVQVCDVIGHPKKFDGQMVRLTGIVQVGFDSFLVRGESCGGAMWLSYPAGTKAKSGARR